MDHSSIQQAGSHSTQIQSITYGDQELSDLRRAIELLEQRFEQLRLDPASGRKAKAQIATLKAQLSDEPNPTILREAGKTLRGVTEGVIGGLIANAAEPRIWQFIHEVLGRLFQ